MLLGLWEAYAESVSSSSPSSSSTSTSAAAAAAAALNRRDIGGLVGESETGVMSPVACRRGVGVAPALAVSVDGVGGLGSRRPGDTCSGDPSASASCTRNECDRVRIYRKHPRYDCLHGCTTAASACGTDHMTGAWVPQSWGSGSRMGPWVHVRRDYKMFSERYGDSRCGSELNCILRLARSGSTGI